jgi:hypothetical protein
MKTSCILIFVLFLMMLCGCTRTEKPDPSYVAPWSQAEPLAGHERICVAQQANQWNAGVEECRDCAETRDKSDNKKGSVGF